MKVRVSHFQNLNEWKLKENFGPVSLLTLVHIPFNELEKSQDLNTLFGPGWQRNVTAAANQDLF